ncbi:MAG TPA: Nif3-like dinuclear metal center hexameric protein [Myxococcota bacterium]|nr:Nif3-like dinuclear metal center hexameric protein [Myxococcota bacterium]
MMLLRDVTKVLEALAPLGYAESWDNVGLLLGDPGQEVRRVLCTIDTTPAVAEEAAKLGCELIVSYHPPWFAPLKRLTAPHLLFEAARRGVAIYSPHTALDVASGGTNDVLCDALGVRDRQPLRRAPVADAQHKLVFFVPEADCQRVCDALFDAGAGVIGDYTRCSFQNPGQGTFLGGDSTQPTVGTRGKLERASEIRVETVLPLSRLQAVVEALRQSHPYEEPAFDLVRLAAPPTNIGIGRIGRIPPTSLGTLAQRLKDAYGLSHALMAGQPTQAVETVAVCAGAGGELLADALGQGADLFVTGELRHHDALKANARGAAVLALLHSGSERAALAPLRTRLLEAAPGLEVHLSAADRDPFVCV